MADSVVLARVKMVDLLGLMAIAGSSTAFGGCLYLAVVVILERIRLPCFKTV